MLKKLEQTKISEKLLCGILLVFGFTIFSSYYVRSVVMPQNGWWHYFAYRMSEGDILYKDIFLFIPPYFTFLTRILYSFFGNHFILYTLFVGFPIKIACIVILYLIICRIVRPRYASLAVIIGACLSSTYLTDVWYDYNPVLMLPALIASYCIMRYYESIGRATKKKYIYSCLLGIVIAILLLSKHSLGITYGFVSLIMLIILHIKYKKDKITFSLGSYIVGIIIGSIPAVIYFIKYNCLNDFLSCMRIATGAKGGSDGLLTHLMGVMSSEAAWGIAIASLIIVVISEHFDIIKIDNKCKRKISLLMEVIIIVGLIYIFKSFIGNYVNYFSSAHKMTLLLLGLILFGILFFIEYRFHFISKNIIISEIIGFVIINIILLVLTKIDIHYIEDIYNQLRIIDVRRLFLGILSYIFVVMYMKDLIEYFIGKQEEKMSSVVMFETLVVVHFFTGIISTSTLEELFAIMYIPFAIAYIFKVHLPFEKMKNVLVIAACIVTIPLCLACKIYIPYDWQGWRQPSITSDIVKCDVDGLEGYYVTEKENEDFINIVNLIEENTSDEDKVYQFANIPLFNVLTNRKIPAYGAISWFDVCPDEVAEHDAIELHNNNPKVVIWHNMSEDEWNLLENTFRNGNKSGQRKILDFYHNDVMNNYDLAYEMPNNRDGSIQVWIRR